MYPVVKANKNSRIVVPTYTGYTDIVIDKVNLITVGSVTFAIIYASGGIGTYEYKVDDGPWQKSNRVALGGSDYTTVRIRDEFGNYNLPFGRGSTVTSTQVAYTPTTAVTAIEPNTVTWESNSFTVPSAVIEFSFTDNSNTWTYRYEDGLWNLYEHILYESITSTVSYIEVTLVTNIQPNTVTFENNEFTVPGGIEEFSFEDDGETWVFRYEVDEWIIYEHVTY